jgi:hypothetical protein
MPQAPGTLACNDSLCPIWDPVCRRGGGAHEWRIGRRWAQHQQRRCEWWTWKSDTGHCFTLAKLRGRVQAPQIEGRAQAQRVAGAAG